MNREDIISKSLLSFVSLKELNEDKLPINMASGCIVKYNAKHFLLTAFHAVGNQQKWYLEIKYEHPTGMKMVPLGEFLFLKKFDLKTLKLEDVDLAIQELDKTITPYYQNISHDGDGKIAQEIPKIILEADFTIKPVIGEKYCFAGVTKPECSRSDNKLLLLKQQLTIEEDILLLGEECDGEIYRFKLSKSHPGHDEYSGCSGSPIFDYNGNIVALVIGGNVQENEIYGISLNKYKIVFDIQAGLIK